MWTNVPRGHPEESRDPGEVDVRGELLQATAVLEDDAAPQGERGRSAHGAAQGMMATSAAVAFSMANGL